MLPLASLSDSLMEVNGTTDARVAAPASFCACRLLDTFGGGSVEDGRTYTTYLQTELMPHLPSHPFYLWSYRSPGLAQLRGLPVS